MLKAIALTMILGTGAAAQSSYPPFAGPIRHGPEEDSIHQKMELNRQNAVNVERHTRMKREADELLVAANELQREIQKSNSDASQTEMLRQLETIERLAHNVKEHMKGAR
jgi:TolA-binding protein